MRTFLRSFIFIALVAVTFSAAAQRAAGNGAAGDLLDKAVARYNAGDFRGAIQYGDKGLAAANQADDYSLIINLKLLLGTAHLDNKELETAASYFLDVSLEGKRAGNWEIAGEALNALGGVYAAMRAYRKAAETYGASAESFLKVGNRERYLEGLAGEAYNYREALAEKRALEKYQELSGLDGLDAYTLSVLNQQLFDLNEKLENWEDAAAYGKKTYEYLVTTEPGKNNTLFLNRLVEAYIRAGNAAAAATVTDYVLTNSPANAEAHRLKAHVHLLNQDPDAAEKSLSRAMNLVLSSGDLQQKGEIYQSMMEANAYAGKPDVALANLRQAESSFRSAGKEKSLVRLYDEGAEIAGKAGKSAYQKELLKAREVVREKLRTERQNTLKDLSAQDLYARNLENRLSLELVKKQNATASAKARELNDKQVLADRRLRSQQFKLNSTLEENSTYKKLVAERDSLLALVTAEKDEFVSLAESLEMEIDSVELSSLSTLSEKKKLDLLLEQQKLIGEQKDKEARQKNILFAVILASILLVLVVILLALYRNSRARKIITEQNNSLEKKQMLIRKRNSQLKKTSDHLLKSNHVLKKTQGNLKSTLVKEKNTRKEMERINSELKKTQVQLIHAEKMSSLGQLTAGIAHEINNPINFVLNSANVIGMNFEELKEILETLLKKQDQGESLTYLQEIDREEVSDNLEVVQEMLGNLKYGADRVTEIVKGLRTFSRFDEAEIKTVDLHENLESSLLILHNKYSDNHIKIVRDFDEHMPAVECYPGQLNQVFVNVLNNAIDVSAGLENPEIRIKTLYNGNTVMISITDLGPGIPSDIKSKIFDPFFTTKDVGKGTGLGLSISHSIIQQHTGAIEAISEPGGGTTFRIELPLRLGVSSGDTVAMSN